MGQARHARRHIARARRDLGQVESADDQGIARYFLAVASLAAGDLHAAIGDYREQLDAQAGEQDLLTRVPLAMSLQQAGRVAEALAVLADAHFTPMEKGPG